MSARMTIKEQRHLSDAIAAMRKSMTLLCRQAASAAGKCLCSYLSSFASTLSASGIDCSATPFARASASMADRARCISGNAATARASPS